MGGQLAQGRPLEEVAERYGDTELLVHGGDDLHAAERVEAVVGQRAAGVDALVQLEHPLDEVAQTLGEGVGGGGGGRGGGGRACRGRGRAQQDPVALRHQDGLAERRVAGAQCVDRGVSLLVQEPGPALRGGERGVRHTQVSVLEGPPALQDTAADGQQRPYGGQFVEDQPAAGPQQRLGPAQGGPQVAGGVDDVGGDDEVGTGRLETLLRQAAFEVEHLEVGEVVAFGEPFPAVFQETRRDVGEGVPDASRVRGQGGQHPFAGGAGAGAQLHHLDRAAPRQLRQAQVEEVADRVADHEVEGVGERVALVEVLHQLHRGAGEHDLGGAHLAAQNARVRLEEQAVEGDGRLDVRVGRRDPVELRLPAVRVLVGVDAVDRRGGADQVAVAGQETGVGQDVEQCLVQPPEAVEDSEAAAQFLGAVPFA